MSWVGHVAVGALKKLHSKFWLDKPKIIQPLPATQTTCKDNTDMAVTQITFEEMI